MGVGHRHRVRPVVAALYLRVGILGEAAERLETKKPLEELLGAEVMWWYPMLSRYRSDCPLCEGTGRVYIVGYGNVSECGCYKWNDKTWLKWKARNGFDDMMRRGKEGAFSDVYECQRCHADTNGTGFTVVSRRGIQMNVCWACRDNLKRGKWEDFGWTSMLRRGFPGGLDGLRDARDDAQKERWQETPSWESDAERKDIDMAKPRIRAMRLLRRDSEGVSHEG